jgi:eukaryotic-like serine/threonine-protein kinase
MTAEKTRLHFADEWELGERIAGGGFGQVFAVASSSVSRAVAKFVPKTPGAERELLFADLGDARNVVPIIDSGETEDAWVLIMPRADASLRDLLIDTSGPVRVDEAVAILIDIARALSDLEGRVVHRDLKPENILLLAGRWCLADFGIARYAEATTAPDTRKYALSPPYAAPERWRSERATSRSDVYAFGVVAHEMLAGRAPFAGVQIEDYREQHLHSEPPALEHVPDDLRALVGECLYKAPEARPSARAIETRLGRAGGTARSAGMQGLRDANLAEVSRRGALSLQQSEAESEAGRRSQLIQAATTSLLLIVDAVREAILNEASTVVEQQRGVGGWILKMGDAELRFAGLQVSENDGRRSGPQPIDVITHSSLSVHVASDAYGYEGRSHSLWFCDAQAPKQYLWFETAFMVNPLVPRSTPQAPFSLPPGEEARSAIRPGLAEVQVAWPFTALVVGELDDFIDRWSGWFADGVLGRLTHPASMPERRPEGSWRRR